MCVHAHTHTKGNFIGRYITGEVTQGKGVHIIPFSGHCCTISLQRAIQSNLLLHVGLRSHTLTIYNILYIHINANVSYSEQFFVRIRSDRPFDKPKVVTLKLKYGSCKTVCSNTIFG